MSVAGCQQRKVGGDAGDSFGTVSSIVEAVDGADVQRLAELVAAPATAVVTLTITEAAYRLGSDGQLDRTASDVVADLAVLASGSGNPTTPLGRLVLALAARRAAGAGPLAVVCCDNLSNNGTAPAARRAARASTSRPSGVVGCPSPDASSARSAATSGAVESSCPSARSR